jgi:hypothetical protein
MSLTDDRMQKVGNYPGHLLLDVGPLEIGISGSVVDDLPTPDILPQVPYTHHRLSSAETVVKGIDRELLLKSMKQLPEPWLQSLV